MSDDRYFADRTDRAFRRRDAIRSAPFRAQRSAFAFLLGVLVTIWFAACTPDANSVTGRGGASSRLPGCPRPCNIILVSIDTLRADHLQPYGYSKPVSPELNAFARESVLFSQVIAQAPSTLSSHAAIFTSLPPELHGASFGKKTPILDAVLSFAEVLRMNGYTTAAFHNGGQLSPEFGLSRGFQTYEFVPEPDMAAVVRQAERWITIESTKPFFLFLHTYAVHHPYRPSIEDLHSLEPNYSGPLPDHIEIDLLQRVNQHSAGKIHLSQADHDHIVNAYDAEILAMDRAFGRLTRFLRNHGIYRDSLLLFTSDHGEEFAEHGMMGWHSHTLFDELLHVPLVIKFPGSAYAGTRVPTQIRSLDIAPTLLATANLPIPSQFRGTDLRRLLTESAHRPLPAVSEIDTRRPDRVLSLRTGRWKLYINAGNSRLYDLRNNPSEEFDVSGSHPALVARLREELERLSSPSRATQRAQRDISLPPDRLEQLHRLGYLE